MGTQGGRATNFLVTQPPFPPGELFLGAPPEKLTLEEARAYCQERGAEIATTGQLYAAWDGGLDRCSPGWLADGSVRYPIVTPSQRCGGGLPGVKTLFLFPNQTGFPNKHSRFNVYCFRGEPPRAAEATPTSQGHARLAAAAEALTSAPARGRCSRTFATRLKEAWGTLGLSPRVPVRSSGLAVWPRGVLTSLHLLACLSIGSPCLPCLSRFQSCLSHVGLPSMFSFLVSSLAEQRCPPFSESNN